MTVLHQNTLALSHVGNAHKLELRHTLPKAALKSTATTSETDDLSNLAFIKGMTNARSFPKKRPSNSQEYDRPMGTSPS